MICVDFLHFCKLKYANCALFTFLHSLKCLILLTFNNWHSKCIALGYEAARQSKGDEMKPNLKDRIRFMDTDGILRNGTVVTVPGIKDIDGHVLPVIDYVVMVRGYVGAWRVEESQIID